MAAGDDDRDATEDQYADLRRYVPAHARPRTSHKRPEDARISVMQWLSDVGHAVLRKLRRA